MLRVAPKKRSEETQTLRAGCSKAEPKIFALPQTPFPGALDGQKLISWRWSFTYTNPVWWGSMHAISSYRGKKPTHAPTHRQDRLLQYTAPQLARSRRPVRFLGHDQNRMMSSGHLQPTTNVYWRTCHEPQAGSQSSSLTLYLQRRFISQIYNVLHVEYRRTRRRWWRDVF